jgi:manganese-dependent inorganic pyrophosphatase
MYKQTYIVGHVNPDTDSIASAIGYTWLLRERDGLDVKAARACVLNPQSSWLINFLGIETPVLLTDASPRFESVARMIETIHLDDVLHDAWSIASRNGNIAPIVNSDGTPFGLVTCDSLFRLMISMVGEDTTQHPIRVREILDLPCSQAANTKFLTFLKTAKIKEYLKKILWSEENIFWLIDSEGKYAGLVNQKDLLNPPRLKIILVDHNEAHQSVPSLDEAELIEIIDHHRLGNSSTITPIHFSVEPVGSTSTLITERIRSAPLIINAQIGLLLMGGIISDTLNLISPTTTGRDKEAIGFLSDAIFRSSNPYGVTDSSSFAQMLLSSGTGINIRSAEDVISNDIKFYSEGNYKFAISQAEVTTNLHELTDYIEGLKNALMGLRKSRGLDCAGLMVTDIVRASSMIIFDNPPVLLDDLPFRKTPENTWIAEGLVSRKKQLIPIILSLIKG